MNEPIQRPNQAKGIAKKNSEQSYATADDRIQQSLEVAAEARRALNYNYVYKAVRCQTE